MIEIFKTNDPVEMNVIELLLKQSSIHYMILDQHMSIMEGSLGILPKRLLVEDAKQEQAITLLKAANIIQE